MADVLKASIWDKTGVTKMAKFLDLAAYRHKLISGNLANSTTPGYAAKDIDFTTEMKQALGNGSVLAMRATDAKHISNAGPNREIKVIEQGPQTEDDLNGVDVDTEVTNLAINQMNYTIGARILQKKVQGLQKAIRGR